MSAPPPLPAAKSSPFSLALLLPYRRKDYHTALTASEIGQQLAEHVITGIGLFSPKEYYGEYTTYSFTVRKVASRLKKQSLSPTVQGDFEERNGRTLVSLQIKPHPIWYVTYAALCLPLGLFLVINLSRAFTNGSFDEVFGGMVPFLIAYGIGWGIFQSGCGRNFRFWEHTLQLRETDERF